MSFHYKIQPFQTEAVAAVVDVFAGQPNRSSRNRVDPGKGRLDFAELGFRNSEIALTATQLLDNLHQVQRRQYTIEERKSMQPGPGTDINLDVEMETGTGKTYVYLKTIFELNRAYGWNKFIVMVPSVAIREGVYASIASMAEHFQFHYGQRIRAFIYNSKELNRIDSFANDGGINLMVINTQAFAARGMDARRIYEELDDFHTRRPIDVIAGTRPVLILDEPQKMEGKVTKEKLPEFKALAILRYSATHKTEYNLVYRLDALDAYNRKLVKKIAPVGVTARSLSDSKAYLYLERIDVSTAAPVARIELEVKRVDGSKDRKTFKIEAKRDLFVKSNELEAYRGYVVADIRPVEGTVHFTNGVVLQQGETVGDMTEANLRRVQIRETINAHFEREEQLHSRGIKVLSLFFIDTVAKYRDYEREDTRGEYARVFEEEYAGRLSAKLEELPSDSPYRRYLMRDSAEQVHEGYFSVDKKSNRLKDPKVKSSGTKGNKTYYSDDVDAYDLILKDKERLLSLDEPRRFIFSHSALREGWDNPNVFVMCFLKHAAMNDSRRQELGRGLRIAVRSTGEGGYVRMDDPAEVHDINVLTVVTTEEYSKYVKALQEEYREAVAGRPRKADRAFFVGKVLTDGAQTRQVDEVTANVIARYLIKNDYTDEKDQVTAAYYAARDAEQLAPLPEDLLPFAASVHAIIESTYTDAALPAFEKPRDTTVHPNANLGRREFQDLWSRINQQQVYQVDFDSAELVTKAIQALDRELKLQEVQIRVERGAQVDSMDETTLGQQGMFTSVRDSKPVTLDAAEASSTRYDLLGKIAAEAELTRATVAKILAGVEPHTFDKFRRNPEAFIAQAARLIVEQKATLVVEHLTYDKTEQRHEADIFTAERIPVQYAKERLQRHVYDFVKTDSDGERAFAKHLDAAAEVVVYAKLPGRFKIPTPVGDYNPDWAIVFDEAHVKHIYFVAETKGSMSSMQLRRVEEVKIDCARKFFERLAEQGGENGRVKYGMVSTFGELMGVVG